MNNQSHGRVSALISSLQEHMTTTDLEHGLATKIFNSASLEAADVIELNSSKDGFATCLSAALEDLASDDIHFELDDIQEKVGFAMASIAQDPMAALESEISMPVAEDASHIVKGGMSGGLTDRTQALEHYDDRDMGNLASRSVVYNMEAVRPSAFTKTIFPFVVFNPESAGVRQVVELLYRQDDVNHAIDGSLTDFNRVGLTHAAIDSSILSDDSTRVIPVHNANTTDNFIDAAVIPDWSIMNEGQSVPTNFLKFSNKVNLIGVSQTEALMSRGVMNHSDQLDVRNSLNLIAYQIGADIVEFPVSPIASAAFSSAHPGPGTSQTLNFSTTSIKLDASSTARADTAFSEAALVAIATNNWTVQLEVSMAGTVDIDTGTQVVYPTSFEVAHVYDAAGVELDLTNAALAPTVAAINGATPLGYHPLSYRSNKNRRQRGKLLGSKTFVEEYYVPMRSPLSTARHVGAKKENADIGRLVSATHIEMDNDAVATLEEGASTLRQFVVNSNITLDRPDYLGLGRFYINPRFIERNIDLPLQINSISSHERMADIRSVLLLQIRDVASRLYLESGFSAGQAVINAGAKRKPLIIIATDDYTASYLNESAGERLLGDQFDSVIVTNINQKMRGKIYILISDQANVEGINPLGAGNTLYAPEMISNLVIDRGGQTSREVTVMRHWRMILNNNVMGLLHVSGLDDVLGSIMVSDGSGVNPDSNPYIGLIDGGTGQNANYW